MAAIKIARMVKYCGEVKTFSGGGVTVGSVTVGAKQ